MENFEATWSEICYLLSESIEPSISERDYESQVVRAIEALGWREYLGEIKRQHELKIGRKNRLRPDLVVFNQKEEALIAIEIKRPSHNLSKDEPADQLVSYMLQLKAEFGLLIGNRIRFYYDGKENPRRSPLLLQRIDFDQKSPLGVQFVSIFNRDQFLRKKYQNTIKELIDNFTAGRNIKRLRELLLAKDTKEKIKRYLEEEFSEFGSDVVEGALNGLLINLSFESEEIQLGGTTEYDPKEGLLATVFDTIKKHRDGISKSELVNVTGFTQRQITNAIYKLNKRNAVKIIDRGMYQAIATDIPPKPASKSAKKKTKKISKKKGNKAPLRELTEGTVIFDLYKLIKRRKNGFTLDDIKGYSDLEGRQLSNALYKLSKLGYIESMERGHYRAIN